MSFSIKFGTYYKNIDVTKIVLDKCVIDNDVIYIPSCVNERCILFTDPFHGVLKSIFVEINESFVEFNSTTSVYIDITSNLVYNDKNVPNLIMSKCWRVTSPDTKLSIIQSKLKLDYGKFEEELPEQIMACRYLTGHEKILEIGGNIGRNSLIMGYILNQKDNDNLVVLESNTHTSEQLTHNRDINNLKFKVENAALSKRKMIQIGWDTICSDEILDGWTSINTITLDELKYKYNIMFDTLVIDCEGAFFNILLDMPDILNNINLIIVENDYRIYENKICVDIVLKNNNFYVDYSEAGGWGDFYNNFYEVWKRK